MYISTREAERCNLLANNLHLVSAHHLETKNTLDFYQKYSPFLRETTPRSWPTLKQGSLNDGQCIPSCLDVLTDQWSKHSRAKSSRSAPPEMLSMQRPSRGKKTATQCWKRKEWKRDSVTGLTQRPVLWDRTSEDSRRRKVPRSLVISSARSPSAFWKDPPYSLFPGSPEP